MLSNTIIMLILTKKHIVSAIISVSVLAAGHQSEASAVLKTDPSVSSGTLDCGLSYYLVDNDSKVGMADFALVRRIEEGMALSSEIGFSRTCLDSLPHFAGRSPLDFMADHGISYPANGYITADNDAVLYHFRDVDLSRTGRMTDSTMLMLFDIVVRTAELSAADSVCRPVTGQAVIISGDIDKESFLQKMEMLSMMVKKEIPCPAGSDSVSVCEKVPEKALSVTTAVDSAGGTATVNIRFSGPEIPRSLRGSSVSLISSQFWNEFRNAAQSRISSVFMAEGIPYSSVMLFRYSSAEAAEREKYLVTAGVFPEDTARAKAVMLSVLASFRADGLSEDEYQYSRSVAARNLYARSVARSRENSDYVRKCADAFLYGSAVVSARDEAVFFLSSGLPDTTGRRLLNEYLAALIPDCGGMSLPESRKAFRMSDTLLFASGHPAVKVKKSRHNKNSDSEIWYFSNGMTAIYKKMPTDGIMHYSWVMRGGYGSVSDLKTGEGAFYSDFLSNANICGMKSHDFRKLLSAEGISMNSEVGLSGMRIYGTAPFSRMTLLMKSLLTVAGTYEEDEAQGQYYLECERLRLSSQRGEYRSRLAAIDSIMSPGYRYYPDKSLSGLYEDLPSRAGKFYKSQFSKADDGALVLVGDMDPYDVKKILESYFGGFSTQGYGAMRPWVNYQPVTGWSTYIKDGRANSLDMVLSSGLVLNSLNYMSAQVVTMAVRDAVAKALSGLGMTVRVSDCFSYFPHERYTVSISAMPVRLSSLPASVFRGSYFNCLYSVRMALDRLERDGLDEASVNMYKSALLDSYKSRQDDPAFWVDLMSRRIITGKNLDLKYEDRIAAVNPESVAKVMDSLFEGCQIEYVIKNENQTK